MRLFFLFLVLLNLVYFLFIGIGRRATGDVNESANTGIRPGIKELKVVTHTPFKLKHKETHTVIINKIQKSKTGLSIGSSLPDESTSQMAINKINYCYSLGPINDELNLLAIENYFKKTQQEFSVKEVSQKVASAYWVYLGGYDNLDQAKKVAKSLQLKGVNGFFIVKSGGDKNSLSLGYFKNPEDARKRKNELVSLGFPARIRPQSAPKKIYWIDYMSLSMLKLPSGLRLAKLIGTNAIQQVQHTCQAAGTK